MDGAYYKAALQGRALETTKDLELVAGQQRRSYNQSYDGLV